MVLEIDWKRFYKSHNRSNRMNRLLMMRCEIHMGIYVQFCNLKFTYEKTIQKWIKTIYSKILHKTATNLQLVKTNLIGLIILDTSFLQISWKFVPLLNYYSTFLKFT